MMCPICKVNSLYVGRFTYKKDEERIVIILECDNCGIRFTINIDPIRLGRICWYYILKNTE